MKKHLDATLPSHLFHMHNNDQFYPNPTWVIPLHLMGPPDVRKATLIWKITMNPNVATSCVPLYVPVRGLHDISKDVAFWAYVVKRIPWNKVVLFPYEKLTCYFLLLSFLGAPPPLRILFNNTSRAHFFGLQLPCIEVHWNTKLYSLVCAFSILTLLFEWGGQSLTDF